MVIQKELAFIRGLGGFIGEMSPPPYSCDVKEYTGEKTSVPDGPTKWVNVNALEKDILARLVPVYRLEDTEDYEPWYIARVFFHVSI